MVYSILFIFKCNIRTNKEAKPKKTKTKQNKHKNKGKKNMISFYL